jgi:two-component system response regulator AtoC
MRVEGASPEALALLMAYHWPGNIRELENSIERAMVLCDGPRIAPELLEEKLRRVAPAPPAGRSEDELSIKKSTRALERSLIERALAHTGGNRTNASKLLEISHRALLYKIKEYDL